MIDLQEMEKTRDHCRSAGFDAAATQLDVKIQRARKLAVAYEFHRYVTKARVDDFNARLYATTKRAPNDAERYAAAERKYGKEWWRLSNLVLSITEIADQLVLDRLEDYDGVPPADVLEAVKVARGRECFDTFEVAHVQPIATKIIHPDPIVFGLVGGVTDRFFIAEWGSDVSIADLLTPTEG